MPPDLHSHLHIAAIGLGSNLGNRARHLKAATEALVRANGVTLISVSEAIVTPPIGPPGQQQYLNAACTVRTSRTPRALLRLLQRIEGSRGRDRGNCMRWGPRTLDLDLLLYDEVVLDEPGLAIPHRRLHERTFVLMPLAQIAADMAVPTLGISVGEAWGALSASAAGGAEDGLA